MCTRTAKIKKPNLAHSLAHRLAFVPLAFLTFMSLGFLTFILLTFEKASKSIDANYFAN